VPVDSALGHHADPERQLAFPPERQWVGTGMGHLDLLSHPEVYAQLRAWLAPPDSPFRTTPLPAARDPHPTE
jgi:hypothetical protein